MSALLKPVVDVAIVGCGPKGLYALESLCSELANKVDPPQVRVVIYEDQDSFGAGCVYDLQQPSFLLMNYAASNIDAWDRDSRPSHVDYLNFTDWSIKSEIEQNEYPARATVGKYLNHCYQRVLETIPQCLEVIEVKERVFKINRSRSGWSLTSKTGSSVFQEVIVCTGHQDLFQDSSILSACDPYLKPLGVYPVSRNLSYERVPPRSRVAIKGFGLTWIDACLSLTVGRGGLFKDGNYEASGSEPLVIAPYSRTGRPLLAKPCTSVMASRSDDVVLAQSAHRLASLTSKHGRLDFEKDIWSILLDTSDRLIKCEPGLSQKWFDKWSGSNMTPVQALRAMRDSIQTGTGFCQPDFAFALGVTWRKSYSHIVSLVSHGGLVENSLESFKAIAAEMERISLGPPIESLEKIVLLIDNGVVNLSNLTNSSEAGPSGWPNGYDCRVDARIPPPTFLSPRGPLNSLLCDNVVARGASGGIRVSASCSVISKEDSSAGLSVLGRPTEGEILGNDTLSRTLHRSPTLWAARVVEKLQNEEHLNARRSKSA